MKLPLLYRFIFSCFAATILTPSSEAGTPQEKPLRLEEAIALAAKNNPSVKISGLEKQIAWSDFRQTDAIFLPRAGISYAALSTNNPLNAFGFTLQQQSIHAADFDPALLNHPPATADFSAQIEVQQPLLNADLLYQRQGARAQAEMYTYQEERNLQGITFGITKAYLQIQWSRQNVEILETSVTHARQMVEFVQNYLEQGLIQKSDELNARVHLASLESLLSKAQSAVVNSSEALSLLIGEPATIYRTDSLILEIIPKSAFPDSIPVNRADFLALGKAVEASEKMILSSKMSRLPRMNAFGSYQWNDSKATGFGANSYLMGIKISWDIFSGTKTRHTIASKSLQKQRLAEQKSMQFNQGQTELNKTFRDLTDARYDIAQQNLSVEQAAESLRILENRHREGLVNTQDVLQAQNQWSQQRLLLAQSIFSYNVTTAYLKFITTPSNQ